jgi:ribosomal protein L16 Arg81 hydroxylase
MLPSLYRHAQAEYLCCAWLSLQEGLGAPVLEVQLCVGDVLYMPRGTVHQAAAQTGDSSHLTISTYQRCSYADLATHLLQVRTQQLQLSTEAAAMHAAASLKICCTASAVLPLKPSCCPCCPPPS